MKKKIAAIALALAALAIGLTGCGEAKSRTWSENGKLKVIATVFPYYDFVRQVAGDASGCGIVYSGRKQYPLL